MSRLTVGSLEGLSENSNVISVPTGHTLNAVDGLQIGGVSAGAYTDHSGSITFNNFTLGNGTINHANYARIGNLVHYHGQLTLGSTSSFSGTPFAIETLPVAPAMQQYAAGQFWAGESGATVRFGLVRVHPSQLLPYAYQETGSYIRADNVDGTTPFTWGTDDYFAWSVIYQAAS